MQNVIETARLRLRPLTESDLPDYQRLMMMPILNEANGGNVTPTPADVAQWLTADRQSPYAFAIEERATSRFMGTVLYYAHDLAADKPEYDIGYFLDPVDWGQGIMPEAIQATLKLVSQAQTTEQIVWATCLLENKRSRRVLEKLGFETVDDHFMAPGGAGLTPVPQYLFRLVVEPA